MANNGEIVAIDALPVQAAPVARPVMPVHTPNGASGARPPMRRGTDGLAIASAVCGFTAIVPVISQVAGLALGIASLARIRRARRCGVDLRGSGWALTGIFSSGFALLCWVVIFAVLLAVGSSFAHTAEVLNAGIG